MERLLANLIFVRGTCSRLNDNGVEGYSDEALALVADTEKTGVPEGVNAVGWRVRPNTVPLPCSCLRA